MGCSFKKHLKRIATPKHWCLGKLGGIYAPRPSSGPHKLRECIPLAILLRNRLKYACTYDEVKLIVMQKLIQVDHKIRTDKKFPIGFQDIITIDKTKENFRMLLDTKGKFVAHKISAAEAKYKLCRVRKLKIGQKGIPYAYLHDGKTLRYINPEVNQTDTVKLCLETGKVLEFYKLAVDSVAIVTGGKSIGRIGKITNIRSAIAAKDIVTLKDERGETFSTIVDNIFVIGTDDKIAISLPKEKGIKLNIAEEAERRNAK